MERDLVVLARDFRNVAASLTSLGSQLRRERLNGSLSITRRDAPAAETDHQDKGGAERHATLEDWDAL